MATKKALKICSDRLAVLLAGAEELRPLLGRRVTGVGFNGDGEGAYTLVFDDGSTATFTSTGDDMTFTSVSISAFQQGVNERRKEK